jgi:site-specific DNA-methyltransferase (adenine-specific)
MINFPLPRLDKDEKLRGLLYKYCRLNSGDIWVDPEGVHKLGCLSASDSGQIAQLMENGKGTLAVHDPPYNLVAFQLSDVNTFIKWCKEWIAVTEKYLKKDSSLYVWLGADQNNHYQPFGEFIVMMNSTRFNSRSLITMRNQRGYGTQKNWMSVRQELLYYIKGTPVFNIEHVYTDIPKILKGYYKEVGGRLTENMERSKSQYIRAGNVWVDIQQVFHLMEENVNGCYAQKPLKSIERIINVSSKKNDIVLDYFSHAGTTLLACEKLKRKCRTVDIDPIYCEISIRRLERFRKTGKSGWQNSNPFADEILNDTELKKYLTENGVKIPKKLSE